MGLGFRVLGQDVDKWGFPKIMENQMEKNMENEMETLLYRGLQGFPKLGYLCVVPITRNIIFWGLYWGPIILGNYRIKIQETCAQVVKLSR